MGGRRKIEFGLCRLQKFFREQREQAAKGKVAEPKTPEEILPRMRLEADEQ